MTPTALLADPVALAREIGDQICATAEPIDGGCRWLSRHDAESPPCYATGVYMGASGIALFLLNLFQRTDETRYRDTALQALRWLESEVAAGNRVMAHPSLVEGRGGLASVYRRAAAVTGDRSQLQAAETHARACAAME